MADNTFPRPGPLDAAAGHDTGTRGASGDQIRLQGLLDSLPEIEPRKNAHTGMRGAETAYSQAAHAAFYANALAEHKAGPRVTSSWIEGWGLVSGGKTS